MGQIANQAIMEMIFNAKEKIKVKRERKQETKKTEKKATEKKNP